MLNGQQYFVMTLSTYERLIMAIESPDGSNSSVAAHLFRQSVRLSLFLCDWKTMLGTAENTQHEFG